MSNGGGFGILLGSIGGLECLTFKRLEDPQKNRERGVGSVHHLRGPRGSPASRNREVRGLNFEKREQRCRDGALETTKG